MFGKFFAGGWSAAASVWTALRQHSTTAASAKAGRKHLVMA